jgi:hypothetical protein
MRKAEKTCTSVYLRPPHCGEGKPHAAGARTQHLARRGPGTVGHPRPHRSDREDNRQRLAAVSWPCWKRKAPTGRPGQVEPCMCEGGAALALAIQSEQRAGVNCAHASRRTPPNCRSWCASLEVCPARRRASKANVAAVRKYNAGRARLVGIGLRKPARVPLPLSLQAAAATATRRADGHSRSLGNLRR